MSMQRRFIDYVIEDVTHAVWPGRLAYRGTDTAPGRGYKSADEAERRIARVNEHYNAKHGMSPGDLRVKQRR